VSKRRAYLELLLDEIVEKSRSIPSSPAKQRQRFRMCWKFCAWPPRIPKSLHSRSRWTA
jgi:hypothetical protein